MHSKFGHKRAVKFGALTGHGTGTSTGTTSAPCGMVSLGQTAHWHSEYTLQKGHTHMRIALRAV